MEPSPEQRLAELREQIVILEDDLVAARAERRAVVIALRATSPPTTWRRIAELTGASEGYWRRELASSKETT